jgi:hypothetical protein
MCVLYLIFNICPNLCAILITIIDAIDSIKYKVASINKRFFNNIINADLDITPEAKDWALFSKLSNNRFGRMAAV